MFDFAQARTNMVDCQIHTNGVIDPRILSAFETIPRENFLPADKKAVAYQDEDIKLGNGRILMEPQVNARMIQLLKPENDDIALVIGDSSGYVSAILSTMVGTVLSLEDDKDAIAEIDKRNAALDIHNVVMIEGDLKKGAPQNGPYSLIFINGSVAEIPESLMQQLTPNGRLVAIVKPENQVMGDVMLFEAEENGYVSSYPHFKAGCPFLKGFEPKQKFSF